MKIIRNKFIPFTGYKAINLFGILFIKEKAKLNEVDINHERIHSEQYKEVTYLSMYLLGIIGLVFGNLAILLSPLVYYIFYVFEWLFRLIRHHDAHKSYRSISFEREAYANEDNILYVQTRNIFNFLKYI